MPPLLGPPQGSWTPSGAAPSHYPVLEPSAAPDTESPRIRVLERNHSTLQSGGSDSHSPPATVLPRGPQDPPGTCAHHKEHPGCCPVGSPRADLVPGLLVQNSDPPPGLPAGEPHPEPTLQAGPPLLRQPAAPEHRARGCPLLATALPPLPTGPRGPSRVLSTKHGPSRAQPGSVWTHQKGGGLTPRPWGRTRAGAADSGPNGGVSPALPVAVRTADGVSVPHVPGIRVGIEDRPQLIPWPQAARPAGRAAPPPAD